MQKVAAHRVPCFIEFDIETGPMERHPDDDFVTVPLSATTGRIVTENGTVLVTFDVSGDPMEASCAALIEGGRCPLARELNRLRPKE